MSAEEQDKGLTWIRRTRKVTVTVHGKVEATQDLDDEVLAIDDFGGRELLTSDLAVLAGAKITPTQVTLVEDAEEVTKETVVNRTTGDFLQVVRRKDVAAEGRATGTCTKVDPRWTTF